MHGQMREARVRLRVGETTFEAEGPEDLVDEALNTHLGVLGRLLEGQARFLGPREPLGLVVTAEAPATERPAPIRPPLRQWYEERLDLPQGRRGFLQDHCLLFVYHCTNVRGQPAATTDDVRRGFGDLGLDAPNVAVMVYNLKTKGMLQPTDAYASYVLTPAGRQYVEDRFGILRRH